MQLTVLQTMTLCNLTVLKMIIPRQVHAVLVLTTVIKHVACPSICLLILQVPVEDSINDDFSSMSAVNTVIVVRLLVTGGATADNMAVTVCKSTHSLQSVVSRQWTKLSFHRCCHTNSQYV